MMLFAVIAVLSASAASTSDVAPPQSYGSGSQVEDRQVRENSHQVQLVTPGRLHQMYSKIMSLETFVKFVSFLGAFVSIWILALMHNLVLKPIDLVAIVGSFGAQSVLLHTSPQAEFAQPWNSIVGTTIGATVGVTSNYFLALPSIAAAFAVAITAILMQLTKSIHPPGGASALIAVIANDAVKNLGFGYVVSPALLGTVFNVALTWVINTFFLTRMVGAANRRYPREGWSPYPAINDAIYDVAERVRHRKKAVDPQADAKPDGELE